MTPEIPPVTPEVLATLATQLTLSVDDLADILLCIGFCGGNTEGLGDELSITANETACRAFTALKRTVGEARFAEVIALINQREAEAS